MLATALGVKITDFFEDPHEHAVVYVRRDQRLATQGNGLLMHDHWTATGLALAVALRMFIWLLPLTVLVFLIGSLIGSDHPALRRR